MAAPERRFLFLLAARLGKTVGELESTMTAAEFGEWFAIWKWQPWESIPSPPSETKEVDALYWAATVS